MKIGDLVIDRFLRTEGMGVIVAIRTPKWTLIELCGSKTIWRTGCLIWHFGKGQKMSLTFPVNQLYYIGIQQQETTC